MTRKRLLALLLLAAVPCAAGCVGVADGDGSARGRTASRGRLTIGRGRSAAAASSRDPRGIDDFSPEGSMERDLAALREREKIQEEKILALQGGLDQRNELVRSEQEKLDEIRQRIDSYGTAIQRYEVASGTARPPRENAGEPSMVPAEMFEDRTAVNTPAADIPAAAVPAAYRDDVSSLPGSPFSSPPAAERKTRTLYSAEIPAPAYSDLPVREYRSSPPLHAAGGGAASEIAAPEYEKGWAAPDNLFSRTAAPSVPEYSAARSEDDIKLDKAVRDQAAASARTPPLAAMAAPAAKPEKTLPRAEFRRTAAPAKTQEPAKAKESVPVETGEANPNDDVFTPDLFLSGG